MVRCFEKYFWKRKGPFDKEPYKVERGVCPPYGTLFSQLPAPALLNSLNTQTLFGGTHIFPTAGNSQLFAGGGLIYRRSQVTSHVGSFSLVDRVCVPWPTLAPFNVAQCSLRASTFWVSTRTSRTHHRKSVPSTHKVRQSFRLRDGPGNKHTQNTGAYNVRQ